MRLTPNFTLREMSKSSYAARNGIDNTPRDDVVDALRALCLNVLQPIRDHFGKPVRVNSGYRSPALNAAIGGSKTSQHMKGEAADIEIDGVDNLELAMWIRDNLPFDQLISECYEPGDPSSGWVHVSFKLANRGQALTYQSGEGYSPGLPTYSDDVPQPE